MTNYGSKIAELRKQKNLTQAELGAELSISAQAISKWENGLSEPDINSLKKLSELFEVSIDELLTPPKETPVQQTEESTKSLEDLMVASSMPSFMQEDEVSATAEMTENASGTPKIINGYCEICKKPVGPDEYQLTHYNYVVKKEDAFQHIYCNECNEKIQKDIEAKKKKEFEAQKRRALEEIARKKEEKSRFFWKGIIWGIVVFAIGAILSIIIGANANKFFGTFGSCLAGSAIWAVFACQMAWDGWLRDFVAGAKDWSWRAPGLIWEFSLDGFMWLIGMKILFWFLGIIFSAVVFLGGLIIALLLSIFTFPFAFVQALRGESLED